MMAVVIIDVIGAQLIVFKGVPNLFVPLEFAVISSATGKPDEKDEGTCEYAIS